MRIAMWLVVVILILCLLGIPSSVYADDEEAPLSFFEWPLFTSKRWPREVANFQPILVSPSRPSWPDSVAGRSITKLDVPPQLDIIEAQRWRDAMPSAKPCLARLYGVPQDTAKIYWANYKIP